MALMDRHDEQGGAAEQDPEVELHGQHVVERAAGYRTSVTTAEGAAHADGEELFLVELAGVAVAVVVDGP